jgi:archaeal flagellar protein FlaJ
MPENRDGLSVVARSAGLLEGLVHRRYLRLTLLLRRSGKVGNPSEVAARSLSQARWAALVTFPLATASALLVSPWLMLLSLLPLAPYFAPELTLRDAVAARKEGVERELPFFSLLTNVLGGAGVPLYTILQTVLEGETFSSIRREALIARRYVNIFGMNPDESMDRLASHHPSKKFGDFLLGYTSKVRSGGDVPSYLAAESGTLLRELEDEWGRYASRVGIVGSMMVTVFGVVPLLLLVVGVFSPAFSFLGLLIFAGLGVPLFTAGLLFLAGRMQPIGEEPVRGDAVKSVIMALAGAAAFPFTGEIWLTLAAVLGIFFTSYGLSTRSQLLKTQNLDEGLSRFLKDLIEYKRQEYDLTRAILMIQKNNRYDKDFDGVLSKAASDMKAGVPLDQVRLRCKSKLGRLVFLVLGQMSRSGGGTVDTVYQLSHYAGRMVEVKRSTRAETRPYLLLSYASPLLLAFGVTFVGGVLQSFSNPFRPVAGGFHFGGVRNASPSPDMTEISNFLIVSSAAALGLIGAKISDLTVRNTLRASTNVCLAVVALVSMSYFASHSLALFVGH